MINTARSRNYKKYHLPLIMDTVIMYNKEKMRLQLDR